MIYISERLFRTARADIFLLEHRWKVCVSTMRRERHALKILPCRKKKMHRASALFQNHGTLLILGCRLIYIYLFRE